MFLKKLLKKTKIKKRQTFWLVDPIDGTSSYIKGGSEYTINAGLIINQKPVAGIIYAPKEKIVLFVWKNKAYEIFDKKEKIKLDCSKIKKRQNCINKLIKTI